jgi:Bacterial regulatory proteins, lacI family
MTTEERQASLLTSNVTPSAAPTLEKVAERAGVSRSSASRATNGGLRVSTEAQASVDAAVADLGYIPNRASFVMRMLRDTKASKTRPPGVPSRLWTATPPRATCSAEHYRATSSWRGSPSGASNTPSHKLRWLPGGNECYVTAAGSAHVEVGTDSYHVTVGALEGEERDRRLRGAGPPVSRLCEVRREDRRHPHDPGPRAEARLSQGPRQGAHV